MKKFALSLIAVFTLCLAAAVAQTATDPSQAAPGSSPSASQQQPGQAAQTDSSSAAPSEKSDKKLRGCIQSQGGKYVLQSKKGKETPLTGQDVSAHVGHEVSVKGSWESGGAGTGVSSGASAEKSFNVASVEMISDTCGAKSSKDGNSGSMDASPSSSPAGTTKPPQ